MGWTGDYSWRTKQNVIDSLIKEYGNKLIKHTVVGNCFWFIFESEGKRYIGVDLIRKSGGEYMTKGMDESVGPCYYSCPISYLKGTEVLNEEWRKSVHEYHGKKNLKKGLAGDMKNLKYGDQIVIAEGFSIKGTVPFIGFARTGRGILVNVTGRTFRLQSRHIETIIKKENN